MAGKISYLLDKKLIQLEGLVGGTVVLKSIQQQKNLCKLLDELNVEIYLTSKLKKIGNVFYVEEPSQKSSNIKKMKGNIIIKPDKTFSSANLIVYAFNISNNKFCIGN